MNIIETFKRGAIGRITDVDADIAALRPPQNIVSGARDGLSKLNYKVLFWPRFRSRY
jgi:hypothetical protein